jgi:hypothetical protein
MRSRAAAAGRCPIESILINGEELDLDQAPISGSIRPLDRSRDPVMQDTLSYILLDYRFGSYSMHHLAVRPAAYETFRHVHACEKLN